MARKSASAGSSLRYKKDGTPIVNSESHVAVAEQTIAAAQEARDIAYAKHVKPFDDEIGALRAAVDKYVIEHYEASDGYEDDHVRLTKVVGHSRKWNPVKLEKLMPRALYKRVIQITVDTHALDQLVRDGKIKRESIESAYEETAKAPYVKRTEKKDPDRAASEAASLEEALA